MELSVLYSKDTRGSVRHWKIWVEGEPDDPEAAATIVTSSGLLDGKASESRREITSGKNLGRKNATTPWQQACAKARSMWTKKRDTAGMVLDVAELETRTLVKPMLAHRWADGHKSVVWPAVVQPKLDGVRCLAHFKDGKVILESRQNKHFPHMDDLRRDLTFIFENTLPESERDQFYFDGELYCHDITFEEITSAVRAVTQGKRHKELEQRLQYWVYDCFSLKYPAMPFRERYAWLGDLIHGREPDDESPTMVKVFNFKVHSPEEAIQEWQRLANECKYEGAMVRNLDAPYALNARSRNLLKLKDRFDIELPICGHAEAKGEDAGTVLWICRLNNGKTVTVRPQGSREYRAELLRNAESYYGKLLTVEIQGRTASGSTRFGSGKAIRDYE